MCWEPDSNPSAHDDFRGYSRCGKDRGTREEKIAEQNLKIAELERQKQGVEKKIKIAQQDMAEICGHPRIQQGAWAHATCMDCGLQTRESYFKDFNPVVFDVEGKNIEEEKRKAREKLEEERREKEEQEAAIEARRKSTGKDFYFKYPTGYGDAVIAYFHEVKELRQKLTKYEKEASVKNMAFEDWLNMKWRTAGGDLFWGSPFYWEDCIKARVQLWELDEDLGEDWWRETY